MARLIGVEIPDKKRIETSLTYIFGIGATKSAQILKEAGIDPSRRTRTLNSSELDTLRKVIEKTTSVEGDLRKITFLNIKRLKDINCYRGIRHQKHLPARGQRTKTNSRTVRGNTRLSAGSGRKPSGQKT
ncbi:MAG: 30S ribosomal protein S13 [bacterium]